MFLRETTHIMASRLHSVSPQNDPTRNKQSLSMSYIIRTFTPAWFAATMGTGAISSLFWVFPYRAKPLITFSLIFFFLNLFLFALFTCMTIARYCVYPKTWSPMIGNPILSLYNSCIPMGATTLLNVAVQVLNAHYSVGGKSFLYTMWGLWWADVAISALCCWGMVHVMFTRQTHLLGSMTALWLLPVVTLVVASSSGGIMSLAIQQYSTTAALVTLAFSGFMVSIGLSLAFMILTLYLFRLIVHGLPSGISILSVFLPVGPTGQSGFAYLLIGQSFKQLLPLDGAINSTFLHSTATGIIIYVLCVGLAFTLWALATMWIIFAFLAIAHNLKRAKLPFKLTFWGLVFPNGVYANLTIQLSQTFDSPFFRIWGCIYAVGTLLLWCYVAIQTILQLHSCLATDTPALLEQQQDESNQTNVTLSLDQSLNV